MWLLDWPSSPPPPSDLVECINDYQSRVELLAAVLLYGKDALEEDAAPRLKHHAETLRLNWRFGRLPRSSLTQFILTNCPTSWRMTQDIWHVEKDSCGFTMSQYMIQQKALPDYGPTRSFTAIGDEKFRSGLTRMLDKSYITSEGQIRSFLEKFEESGDRFRVLADILCVLCGRLRLGISQKKNSLIEEIGSDTSNDAIEVHLPFRDWIGGIVEVADAHWLDRSLQLLENHPTAAMGFSLWLSYYIKTHLVRKELQEVANLVCNRWCAQVSAAKLDMSRYQSLSFILMGFIAGCFFTEGIDARLAKSLETHNTSIVDKRVRSISAGLTHIYYTTKISQLQQLTNKSQASDDDPNWWHTNSTQPDESRWLSLSGGGGGERDLLFIISLLCGARKCQLKKDERVEEIDSGRVFLSTGIGARQSSQTANGATGPRVEVVERLTKDAFGLSMVVSRNEQQYFHGDLDPTNFQLDYPGKAIEVTPEQRAEIEQFTNGQNLPFLLHHYDALLESKENTVIPIMNNLVVFSSPILAKLRVAPECAALIADHLTLILKCYHFSDELGRNALAAVLDEQICDIFLGTRVTDGIAMAQALQLIATAKQSIKLTKTASGVAPLLKIMLTHLRANRHRLAAVLADSLARTKRVLWLSLAESNIQLYGAFTTGLDIWHEISAEQWQLFRILESTQSTEQLQLFAQTFLKSSCERGTLSMSLGEKLKCKKYLAF